LEILALASLFKVSEAVMRMPDTSDDDLRCPNCGSTDLTTIQNKSLDGELVECRSCTQAYQLMYEPDGVTPCLVRL